MVGIGPDGEEFWNRSHDTGITSSPLVVTEVEEPYDPFIVYGDESGRLHGIEVHNPYVARLAILYNYVEWHIKLGSSIQSSPFVWHEKIYVGVERADGGGRVVCIGSIDPDNEPYVEVLDTRQVEGEVQVEFVVHNLLHDNATVEFMAQNVEASRLPGTEPSPTYRATLVSYPPEGLKPFTIRLYLDGEVQLTYRGEVMCLVEGWAKVELKVATPKNGQSGVEGILLASGTVSSNYTIRALYAEWGSTGEMVNATIAPNWTLALETEHLDGGEQVLRFVAYDGYRTAVVEVQLSIGKEEMRGVEPVEVVPLLILIVVLVVLLRTKPPRVSEKASGQ
jgi:hypothetical protein